MSISKPIAGLRGLRGILTATAMVVSVALTLLYPDTIPVAIYFVEPGASALRDASIPVLRSGVNAVVWGFVTYMLVRVSERLRHKNR